MALMSALELTEQLLFALTCTYGIPTPQKKQPQPLKLFKLDRAFIQKNAKLEIVLRIIMLMTMMK